MISGENRPGEEPLFHLGELLAGDVRGAGELEAHAEEVVVHQEGEKDVRPDVEGVVRLEDLREVGLPRLGDEDPPGEEHPRGLAADPPRSDQAVPDGEEVVEGHIRIDQPAELRMGSDHHPGELLLERGDLGGFLVEVQPRFMVLHEAAVDALPGGDRFRLHLERFLDRRGCQGGGVPAPEHRRPDGIGHDMGEEHLGGIAVPDLEGVEVHAPVDPIDVQEELGRVPDPGDGPMAVAAAGEGEVGHRVEFEEEGAGHLEEVRQEFVGRPLDDERREAVEDVEDLPPLRLDDVVEVAAEGVEAGVGAHLDRGKAVERRQDGRVGCETEIDRPPPVPDRLPGEGLGEEGVILQAVHLPDDVVAQPEPLEHLIQRRQAAGNTCRFHPSLFSCITGFAAPRWSIERRARRAPPREWACWSLSVTIPCGFCALPHAVAG